MSQEFKMDIQKKDTQQLHQKDINQSLQIKEAEQIHIDSISQRQTVDKLSVQIFPKQIIQNPQRQSKENPNQKQTHQDHFGPFNNDQVNHSFQLKNVNESINYQIQISPVLTNLQHRNQTLGQDSLKRKFSKNKKSSNILTQQSNHELQFSKTNEAELQKQILALAKSIRQKVKKNEHKKEKSPEVISPTIGSAKKLQNKSVNTKLKKVYEKRQSIFQKYSSPRSVSIDLSQLQKQQAKLKVGKYTLQKVYKQQSAQEFTESLEIISQKLQSSIKIENRSGSKTQSQKERIVVQLPKLKLNFDKTHHKYQMTEFRKNIIKEKKNQQMAKSLIIKQKLQTLHKRRQIYNTSRYHPVGIRLSSLRTSRIPNAQINLKDNLLLTQRAKNQQDQRDFSQLNLLTPIKQNSHQLQEIKPQLPIISSELIQTLKTPLKSMNPSEIKSSLTFNFSFSDPINPNYEAKSQKQIMIELQNVAKDLQNDSDMKEKFHKIQEEKKQIEKGKDFEPKKWAPINQQMTQSKHIEQVKGLHNSSSSQNDQDENYNDVQLQYSYI